MTKRIETRFEIQTFIDQLKYAIDDQNVHIEILSHRLSPFFRSFEYQCVHIINPIR